MMTTKMSSAIKEEPKDVEYVTVEVPEVEEELGTKEIEKLPESPAKQQFKVTLDERREDTRGKLAQFMVVGFFTILVIAAVLSGISEGNKVDNLKEALILVSGILSGPLGFVIGYYFRKQEQE